MKNNIINPLITVVFSHGRYGSPMYGTKIQRLRSIPLQLGINIISVGYNEKEPAEILEESLFNTIKDDVNVPGDLILLSFSRGGYLTTRVSEKISKLFLNEDKRITNTDVLPRRNFLGSFLLAPALYIKPNYYKDQNPKMLGGMRTTVVQGYQDKYVDYKKIIQFTNNHKQNLHLLNSDHGLNDKIELISNLFEQFLKDCKEDSIKCLIEEKNKQKD